jgi:hypothetical protein
MSRRDGLDKDLFLRVISGLPESHKALAHQVVSEFGGVGGNLMYAEATTVDGGQNKYNFLRPDGSTCWLAIINSRSTISFDVRDRTRSIRNSEVLKVEERGKQFEKGFWRRVTVLAQELSGQQIAEIVESLRSAR